MPLDPAPARSRTLHRIINITDLDGYKKLSRSLAPAELSHLRARVRTGEPGVVTALFNAGAEDDDSAAAAGVRTNGQGYTWACMKTTWWEKGGPPQGYIPGHGRTVMARPGQGGKGLMLEVGLAALRCANLRAVVSACPDLWTSADALAGCLATSAGQELPESALRHGGMGRQGEPKNHPFLDHC
jgi:hypothetical protein